MRYLWTEDTGAGLHFWKLVSQLFFNNELVVESKGNNQGLLDAVKSLVGEFTQNEKWSVKGLLMGECWYKNCCVSEHQNSLRCGKPEIKDGSEKMRVLMQSKEIEKILITIAR